MLTALSEESTEKQVTGVKSISLKYAASSELSSSSKISD
jgi:hypothetical protein